MGDGAQVAQHGGIADQDIEFSEAFEDRQPQLVDLVEIGQIDRYQGCCAAGRPDPVVHLFQSSDRPCRQDDMGALCGETFGDSGADAA
jgi:hypothetical protein